MTDPTTLKKIMDAEMIKKDFNKRSSGLEKFGIKRKCKKKY